MATTSIKSLKLHEANKAKKKAFDAARPKILQSVAKRLSEKCPRQWIAASSILPDFIPKTSWQTLVKNASKVEMRGTDHFESVEGYHLFRHKFGCQFYFWCCNTNAFSGDNIDALVNVATKDVPSKDVPRLDSIRRTIGTDCREVWKDVQDAKKAVVVATAVSSTKLFSPPGRTTRSDATLKKLKDSPPEEALVKFDTLHEQERLTLFRKLLQHSNRLDELEDILRQIKDKPMAQGMLEQFNCQFMNRAFVDRALASEEVARSGSIAPRKSGFDDLGPRGQRDVSTVMSAIAMRVAQVLLPHQEKQIRLCFRKGQRALSILLWNLKLGGRMRVSGES